MSDEDAIKKLIEDPEGFLAEVRRRERADAERETDRRIARARYCKACDFYTDHVSTAHDGLEARGLLLPKADQ